MLECYIYNWIITRINETTIATWWKSKFEAPITNCKLVVDLGVLSFSIIGYNLQTCKQGML